MLKLIKFLPDELKYKIMSYYPIINNIKHNLNKSIKSLHLLKIIKKGYKIYFATDSNSLDLEYMDVLSSEWLISDIFLYLRSTSINEKIILKYYDTLDQDNIYIEDFACFMDEHQIKSFWIYCNRVYNMDEFVSLNL